MNERAAYTTARLRARTHRHHRPHAGHLTKGSLGRSSMQGTIIGGFRTIASWSAALLDLDAHVNRATLLLAHRCLADGKIFQKMRLIAQARHRTQLENLTGCGLRRFVFRLNQTDVKGSVGAHKMSYLPIATRVRHGELIFSGALGVF
jgi:hypothetical protein